MTAVGSKSPATVPPPRVSWSDGVVELRDERTFGPGGEAFSARLLSRVFRVEGVVSVTIDRAQGTAAIRHEPVAGGRAALLARLAEAIRRDDDSERPPPFVRGSVRDSSTEYHRGPILPVCKVMFDGPGRLRLRIAALRLKPDLAHRVERLLESVPGVRRVSAGSWLGRLLVQYDPNVLPRARLFDLIGEALYGPDVWARAIPEPATVNFGLINITLGVATVGQFAAPALLPVCAGLLIASNFGTFRTALLQVRRRRTGLPVLYTAIVVTTLASGQFVTSALMTWFFGYWKRRALRDLTSERHRLLDACMPLPGLVRLLSARGSEVLVAAEHVRPGDRVMVAAETAIPVDGRIVQGEAVVDERSLRGTDGATRKRVGDAVLAGSYVLAGEIVVAADRPLEQTRAAAVGRSLVATTNPAPGASAPTLHAEAFAERAVGPTLATAGFGLLVGDLASVSAILRPDYATGLGVGVPLAVLRAVAVCARRGVVVHDATAFERLARVDLVVLDDQPALARAGLGVAGVQSKAEEAEILRYAASAYLHLDDARSPALREACRARSIHLLDLPPIEMKSGISIRHGNLLVRVREQAPKRGEAGPLLVEANGSAVGVVSFRRGTQPEAAGVVRRLRDAGLSRFAIVSDRPSGEVAPLAAALGVNQLRTGLDRDGKAAFLRSCRERGLKAAFVGDCRRNPGAAAEAYLAVALAGEADAGAEPTPRTVAFQLLGERLDRLELLWDTARSHTEQARLDHAFVMGPNLACVAGAFLFGFGGLTAVALTNLGTYGVYSRAAGSLRAQSKPDRLRRRQPSSA